MKDLTEARLALLEIKRQLILDLPESAIPSGEIDSAHFWSAVAHLELSINTLALAIATRGKS